MILTKAKAYRFRFNAILNREEDEDDEEEEEEGCYASWSLPNPKAWLVVNVKTPAFSRSPVRDEQPSSI